MSTLIRAATWDTNQSVSIVYLTQGTTFHNGLHTDATPKILVRIMGMGIETASASGTLCWLCVSRYALNDTSSWHSPCLTTPTPPAWASTYSQSTLYLKSHTCRLGLYAVPGPQFWMKVRPLSHCRNLVQSYGCGCKPLEPGAHLGSAGSSCKRPARPDCAEFPDDCTHGTLASKSHVWLTALNTVPGPQVCITGCPLPQLMKR